MPTTLPELKEECESLYKKVRSVVGKKYLDTENIKLGKNQPLGAYYLARDAYIVFIDLNGITYWSYRGEYDPVAYHPKPYSLPAQFHGIVGEWADCLNKKFTPIKIN